MSLRRNRKRGLGRRGSCVAALLLAGAALSGCHAEHEVLSGAPDASHCQGVAVTPDSDLTALARTKPEGTTFCLSAGEYRGVSVIPRAGQRFLGESGTILNGSRLLTSFEREGALFLARGQTQKGQVHGSCDALYPRCAFPEDLYFDNVPLLHVARRENVAAGKWFFDYDAQIVYFADNPQGHRVEIGRVRNAFAAQEGGGPESTPQIPGVVLDGLVIEKYSIPQQMGAIGDQYPSAGWTIRNCEVRNNHGMGVRLQGDSTVVGSHLHHNGAEGVGGTGPSIVILDTEIDHDNLTHYNAEGAIRFSSTDQLVFRHNRVHDNAGPGVFTVGAAHGTLYDDNEIIDNEGNGILHAAGDDLVIRNNVLRGNGYLGDYVSSAEILVHDSARAEVYGNRVEVGATSGIEGVVPNTRHAIVFFQDSPSDAPSEGRSLRTREGYVHDNVVVFTARQKVLTHGAGTSGAGEFSTGQSAQLQLNRFDSNRYLAPDCEEPRFFWVDQGDSGPGSGSASPFSVFQAMGHEVHGSCGSE